MTIRIVAKYPVETRSNNVTKLTYVRSKPALGAHLVSNRTGYTHHGIYAGDDKVIHYAGLADDLSSGVVEETTLEAFSNGNGFSVKPNAHPRFTEQAVIDRARSRLGEDEYNVLSNNCEHFCEWCINGEHHSEQVEQAKTASTKGLVAFTLLRTFTPPQISIPLSIAYGAYCLLQKNDTQST